MEVNVFSPGGLGSCQSLYNVNFAEIVIEALERKVAVRPHTVPTSTTPALPPSPTPCLLT